MLADLQRTVYPDEVTRQLHVMVLARESSPVITTVLRHELELVINLQDSQIWNFVHSHNFNSEPTVYNN